MDLIDILEDIGPAPCDECEQREVCSVSQLACREYFSWVNDAWRGEGRKATREVYDKIYSEDSGNMRIKRMQEMWADGVSAHKIADELSIKTSAVYAALKRNK